MLETMQGQRRLSRAVMEVSLGEGGRLWCHLGSCWALEVPEERPPSGNIHPKHAGGQVPGNRAPVPGCVLKVELRRAFRFSIGCSLMDGSPILQCPNTFHPRATRAVRGALAR